MKNTYTSDPQTLLSYLDQLDGEEKWHASLAAGPPHSTRAILSRIEDRWTEQEVEDMLARYKDGADGYSHMYLWGLIDMLCNPRKAMQHGAKNLERIDGAADHLLTRLQEVSASA